ncbi:MAG: hypothetical protein IPJ52_11240 [Rhodocyclaceae bacterium]|nr:hypothetical protein [Rhodocyclaceae bacterium]
MLLDSTFLLWTHSELELPWNRETDLPTRRRAVLNDPLPNTLSGKYGCDHSTAGAMRAIRIARQQLAIELLPANDGRRVGDIPKVFDTNQHKG